MRKILLFAALCCAGFVSAVVAPKPGPELTASPEPALDAISLVPDVHFVEIDKVPGATLFYAKCAELPKTRHSVALKSAEGVLAVEKKGTDDIDFARAISKKQNVTALFVHPKPELSFVVQVTFGAKDADVRIYGTQDKIARPTLRFIKTSFAKHRSNRVMTPIIISGAGLGAFFLFGFCCDQYNQRTRRHAEREDEARPAGEHRRVPNAEDFLGPFRGPAVVPLTAILRSDETPAQKVVSIVRFEIDEADPNQFSSALRFAIHLACYAGYADAENYRNALRAGIERAIADQAFLNRINAHRAAITRDGIDIEAVKTVTATAKDYADRAHNDLLTRIDKTDLENALTAFSRVEEAADYAEHEAFTPLTAHLRPDCPIIDDVWGPGVKAVWVKTFLDAIETEEPGLNPQALAYFRLRCAIKCAERDPYLLNVAAMYVLASRCPELHLETA